MSACSIFIWKDSFEFLNDSFNYEIVPSFLAEHALDEFKSRGYPINIIETNQGHELTSENLEQLTNFFNSWIWFC